LPAEVSLLSPAVRVLAGALRVFSRASLLGMVIAALVGDDLHWQTNTLAQIRFFMVLFVAPEAAAWCVLRAFAARASLEQGALVLRRGSMRMELALHEVAELRVWRLPIPGPGLSVRLASGPLWRYGLAHPNPLALAQSLAAAGAPALQPPQPLRLAAYLQARFAAPPGRLYRPFVKFALFPLLLAIPAFRLHQHIAYGSAFGEYYSFGLKAYLTTFALWWAAWTIGVLLCAAALRTSIEAGTMIAAVLRPAHAVDARRWLERLGLALLYLGLPAWLLLRTLSA
jgi:apolipoprotein N-acyltransferase